jgi:3-oxoacyl-[acyl-carrier protein] reductase
LLTICEFDDLEMKGWALVTGAGRGIGRAIAVELAAAGYRVLINYLGNDAAAAETLAAVREAGSEGELMRFDVSDGEAVAATIEAWKEANPDAPIEVLVNNAGVREDGLMMWMERAQWNRVVETGLGGFFNVTRAVLLDMLKAKRGRIVNVVSLSGIKGLPGQTNYSAAKGGVIAATKALAQEVARKGVTVNAVAPGFIRTDMTADMDEAELRKQIPAGRFGEPREVAAAVAFLVSPGAAYITGEVISINGGLYT